MTVRPVSVLTDVENFILSQLPLYEHTEGLRLVLSHVRQLKLKNEVAE